MGEEHFDLLPELHRDFVLARFGDVAGDLAGVFVFLAGDRSGICLRAAFRLGRAGLAGQFQGTVFGSALSGRPPVRVGIVPAELLQCLALGADVLVVLGVPLEVRPAPCAVGTSGLVEDRDVRCDLALDQPAQHRPGAMGGVGDQAFGMQVEPGPHPFQHGLGRAEASGLAGRDLQARTRRTAPVALPASVPSSLILPPIGRIESARCPSIKREFFNRIRPS